VIPHLKGWQKVFSGESLTLYPPGGSQVGGIRYRERVRPMLRVSQIVEQMLARYPQFTSAQVGAMEMIITAEGEYGALVTIAGQVGGAPAQRDIGVVFGDDFYAMISALCVVPDRFAEFTQSVTTLVKLDSHALGVRRRRFLYEPPAGWQGLPRGFTTEWSPMDFPRDLSLIHIFPANPVNEPPQAVLDQMLAEDRGGGFVQEELKGPEPVRSDHGLAGQTWQIVGRFGDKPKSIRNLIVYKDPRFLYSMRLETMQENLHAQHLALFQQVARSAHPIPMPGQTETKQASAVGSHWAL
jgi:hypothetical protein